MSNGTLGVGVAGLGRMGGKHADNLAERVRGARLVRVVDTSGPVAKETGQRLGVAWSTDYETLLDDPAVDAIVVATPGATHADITAEAAAAGRHVFCEKPLAFTLEDAERAVLAADTAGVTLQIGFQIRCDPDFATLAARVRAGELGTVSSLNARLRDMHPPPSDYLRSSGGLFLDGAIHLLDLARWLAGPIVEVASHAADIDVADPTVSVLRFASGAIGVLENSRTCRYGFDCSVEVVGSKCTARVENNSATRLEWRTPHRVSRDHVANFLERFSDAYRLELEAFVNAIRRPHVPVATGEDALAAMAAALAAQRSLREGRSLPVRPLGRLQAVSR